MGNQQQHWKLSSTLCSPVECFSRLLSHTKNQSAQEESKWGQHCVSSTLLLRRLGFALSKGAVLPAWHMNICRTVTSVVSGGYLACHWEGSTGAQVHHRSPSWSHSPLLGVLLLGRANLSTAQIVEQMVEAQRFLALEAQAAAAVGKAAPHGERCAFGPAVLMADPAAQGACSRCSMHCRTHECALRFKCSGVYVRTSCLGRGVQLPQAEPVYS